MCGLFAGEARKQPHLSHFPWKFPKTLIFCHLQLIIRLYNKDNYGRNSNITWGGISHHRMNTDFKLKMNGFVA